jgi:terminase small subunit / prophage DNA-packing protein
MTKPETPRTIRQPHWLNGRQMAASCGVSVQAFVAWRVEPVAKIGREQFYTAEAVLKNRLARAERARPPDPSPDALDADRERTLLTRVQREGQELKNAQLRKELAPISLLSWTLGKVGNQIGAVLDSIPLRVKKVAPRLSALELETIKREVVKAQNAAARVTIDLDEYYANEPGELHRP